MDSYVCEQAISRFRKSGFESYKQIQINIQNHRKSKSELRGQCKNTMLFLKDINTLVQCDILESKYPGYRKKTIPVLRKMKQVSSTFYNRECKIYEEDIQTENLYKLLGI